MRGIYGIAPGEEPAVELVSRLEQAGFSGEQVSVIFPRKTPPPAHDHAAEGAMAGAGAGGLLGGVAAFLAGLGALAIPGIGAFVAAGPILSALSGAALGVSVGTLTGALVGLGLPDHTARTYEERLGQGHYLIGVHGGDTERARELFVACGAEEIVEVEEAE